MGAGKDHRFRRTNKVGIDIVLVQPHVGTVLPIEDQRECLPVPNAENDQGGQAARIDLDAPGLDPLARQGFDNETAHMFITHTGNYGGLEA